MMFDCSKVTPADEHCECDIFTRGGWCEPHQVNKTKHYVKLCRTKPAYRLAWNQCRGPLQQFVNVATSGPGTELTQLLSRFKVIAGGCQCKAHARQMDSWGPDKCLEKMDIIVSWLRSEAKKRHLPFSSKAATWMVKLAIRRARHTGTL